MSIRRLEVCLGPPATMGPMPPWVGEPATMGPMPPWVGGRPRGGSAKSLEEKMGRWASIPRSEPGTTAPVRADGRVRRSILRSGGAGLRPASPEILRFSARTRIYPQINPTIPAGRRVGGRFSASNSALRQPSTRISKYAIYRLGPHALADRACARGGSGWDEPSDDGSHAPLGGGTPGTRSR